MTATGDEHNVARVVPHPKYNRRTLDYDYAILELSNDIPLTATSKARAACLPTADTDVSGANFTVSGWGTLSYGGGSPSVLHSVTVPHVADETCNEIYAVYGGITDRMMCAGGLAENTVDSCQGDSGGNFLTHIRPSKSNSKTCLFSGPLTWVDPNTSKVNLVGVVSWGIGN